MVPIFSLVTYIHDRFSTFSSYLKVLLQAYVKSGGHLLLVFKTKLRVLPALRKIHRHSRSSTATSCFTDNVSGKVWPRPITPQLVGIYPEVSLGFATVTPPPPPPRAYKYALCVG